jgi:ADP-ribosylglycohydrolase
MQAGLWGLQQTGSLEATLLQTVNAGGDTDTNGADAGAVLGARDGIGAIPPRWLENIRDIATVSDIAGRLLLRATEKA